MRMTSKKQTSLGLEELFDPYARITQNYKGSLKFLKAAKNTNLYDFAKLAKSYHFAVYNPLSSASTIQKHHDVYYTKLEGFCTNIITKMKQLEEFETGERHDDYITTVNGLKLTTEGVNPYEFVRDYYDVLFCDVVNEVVDKRFREACGITFLHFLEEIDYNGKWTDGGSCPEKGSIVVDVGGGYGFFALLALQLGAKKVYVFEPNTEARNIIIKNRELNGYTKDEMVIYPYALGDKSRTTYLMYKTGFPQTSTLRDIPPDTHFYIKQNREKVEIITFDMFYQRLKNDSKNEKVHIDFIKIHTNGSENEVVKGATYYLNYNESNNLADFAINTSSNSQTYKNCKSTFDEVTHPYLHTRRWAKMHSVCDKYHG